MRPLSFPTEGKKTEREEGERMYRFIALDVETPNRLNRRMSAIGVTTVEEGKVVDDFYSLVDPETSFDYFNTVLTGLDENTVAGAPTFRELWAELGPRLEGGILVAHNAVFDLGVLKRCLWDYDLEWKSCARYVCTVQMGRRVLPGMGHKLNELCEHYGIALDHHRAGSDAHACAEILLRYIADGADVSRYIRTYKFT